MKARYDGECPGCGSSISSGEEIGILLKRWYHGHCKRAELAARSTAAGPAVEIPQAELPVTPQYVGTRHWRRRNQKFMRRRDTPERPC